MPGLAFGPSTESMNESVSKTQRERERERERERDTVNHLTAAGSLSNITVAGQWAGEEVRSASS